MNYLKKMGRRVIAFILTLCLSLGLCTGITFVGDTVKEVKAADTGFTQNDFLKCDGIYVKNNYGKGNNVYLRGTNIGNLFVQESWMSSTNATDQKTILENLTSRFGQDKALELLDYYESNYFTEADIDNCKNMGMSVIRVPFTYMNLYKKSGSSWVLRSDAFTRLDWIVNECSKRGIYVILDLHGAFGSQNGQDHSGQVISNASDVTFFSNETLMSQTLELWKVVAQHYAGNPAVAGYDTLNEPGEKAGTTSERHWKFYDRMYDTIRAVDPDHIIIMESCWGTANLPNPSTYGWTNVMYEYHHYPWDYVSDTDANYTGQVNAINNLVNSVNSANYGVPTYIGEFNCFDGDAKWQYVLDKMNKAGWHYTNWSYKSRGMGSWGIYHEAGTEKVTPSSTSEADILRIWGSSSVGTNNNDTGVTYKNMKAALPGTVVMADTALTNDSYFSIKTNINNCYVCAEDYGESPLISDRTAAGEWEQFRIIYNSDGTVSFQSRANNKYLCTVFDDTDTENPILPRSNQISTWEKFYLEQNSDGTYALRTYVNNYYVQADIEDTNAGILHAIGASVGTWERLTFEATNAAALPSINGGNQQEETTSTPEQTTKAEEPSTTAPVTTTVNCPGTFDIEDYSAKSAEIAITTNDGVKLAGNLVNGSYLEYQVNAATAGKYELLLGLATTSSGRTLTISVDGNTAGTISPAAASTWVSFETYKTVVSFATAGVHTVRISASGSCNIANPSFVEYEEEVSVEIPTISSSTKYGNDYKVVAYYPNWYGNITSRVQWDKLTHSYYAFGLPDGNGSGTMESISGQATNIQAMINACNNNNVVPVLSVGGWSYTDGRNCSEVFAANTNTTAKCQSLAESIVTQAKQYGFKGIDIDWEYPTSSTQAQYTTFMKNLRTLCDQNNMILTVAVAATSGSGFTSEVLNLLDFVNIMAYDGDSGSGHSPYDLATRSFTYWRDTMGVPANKLVIGVPFYERPNWASYADIVSANSNNAYSDSAVINGTTVYYNGITTMSNKAKYAAENAGGIMIWEISQDTTNSSLSLLNAIYNTTLPIVGEGTTTQATVTEIPGTVKVDSYGGKTSSITLTTENNITYAGNLNDASYLDYYIKVPAKGTYTIDLGLAAGDAQWNAKNIIVKLNDTAVATVPVTESSSWTTFLSHTADITFAAKGTYKLSIVSDGGACNVTDFTFTKKAEESTEAPTEAPTEEPTETPTEAPTEAPEKEFAIEVNGYQISTTIEGHRVVYSISDPNEEVLRSGLVYGVAEYASEADMVVNSTNSAVKDYQSTEIGKSPVFYGTFEQGQSFTMTMQFVDSVKYYSDQMMVRAYAQLKNGQYVYSDVQTYTIYRIADLLYQNRKMNTSSGHDYLFNKILSVVNPEYKEVDFDWGNIVVKPQ